MTFDEWIDKLIDELKKKYRIIHLAVTTTGMTIDFEHSFNYYVSLGTLKNLWSVSCEDHFRWDDSVEIICKGITREYMKQIM